MVEQATGSPGVEPNGVGMAQIKVIGVGGGGCNAVSRMYRERVPGVEYIVVNTDAQHLMRSEVPVRVRIGDKLTRGLGVGGDPDMGREAAEESRQELYEVVRGSDMVFIAAGMGGGTGTGAAPVLAEVAKETGALTIAVVTRPFGFEGAKRRRTADDGVHRIKDKVDTLIIIPNDRLLVLFKEKVSMENAFRAADEVLRQGVQAIAELVTLPGEVNLDFADVKAIMSGAGPAWMAIGTGRGEKRAIEAAKNAVSSPLLDASIEGAKGVLFRVTGGPDVTLQEVQQAADVISQVVDPDANIIFGLTTDPKMEDEVQITVIATGFPVVEGSESQDRALAELLSAATPMEEANLDLPPFLRRSPMSRRRASGGI